MEFERSFTPAQTENFISTLYDGYKTPEALYPVDVYQLVFESTYPDGSPARAFAQVFLPRFGNEERDFRGLYVFAPGSTGLLDNCRASREHEAGIRWGLYRAHVLSHAARGTIAIQPDYLGFRDPERYQYYMVAEAEAAVLLDSIRAMKKVFMRTDYRYVSETVNFAGGFSQGGHAILAAADFRSRYAPELELTGVVGFGATANPLQLMLEYPGVAPMIVYTYWQLYGRDRVDPWRILRPEYADFLEDDVLSQCVGGMQSYYPHDPEDLYTPEFYRALRNGSVESEYPELARVMADNTVGYRSYGTDILLMQGGNDIVIFPDTQRAFLDSLQQRGLEAEMIFYPSARHDTRQISYNQFRQWMDGHIQTKKDVESTGVAR